MSQLLDGLNPQQQEAVLSTDGPVLILAGAGSGKTRAITRRIAHLVLDKGVAPDRILAVTFTNKAAAEMKARVETLLGGRALGSWVSTFHSLCVRILRREAAAAGLPAGFVIYDQDDQLAVVREALRGLDLSEKLHPPRRILSRISARKNSGSDPADADSDGFGATSFARIAERYQQQLDQAQALDFDDLLLRCLVLLKGNAGVREAYRQRFQYVLVDEYQDTNRAQYEIVRHLAGPKGNLTVVGDEDQSIYSWRGADIRNILDFEHDFPGARVLRLEENYRSSQAILDAASGLVSHNRRRKGKVLRAVRPFGEAVQLHQASDEFEEAAWVVGRITALRRQGRCAVLYRMNAQSRLLEEALMRAGIAYAVVGGVGFYERREVRDLLAYLRLLLNPRDPVALKRVVNVPARGIGERTIADLERIAAERGVRLWDALGIAVDESLLSARAAMPLARFREMLDGLRGEAPGLSLKGLLERTLAATGYSAMLAADDSQDSEDRLENLAELLSAAAEFEARQEGATLADFLDRVSLLSDTDSVRGDGSVVLMTLHSAKGLEFDAVFLVGLEEGLVPHSRSLTGAGDEALEEERRLCYVGMTRAMQHLHLSWAQSRLVFGQRRVAQPSRFLDEIPREALVMTGLPAVPRTTPRRSPAWTERRDWTPPAPGRVEGFPPGARVRHPLFGVGTVVRSEGSGDDLKLTVTFTGIGAKRLVARYAGLEPA